MSDLKNDREIPSKLKSTMYPGSRLKFSGKKTLQRPYFDTLSKSAPLSGEAEPLESAGELSEDKLVMVSRVKQSTPKAAVQEARKADTGTEATGKKSDDTLSKYAIFKTKKAHFAELVDEASDIINTLDMESSKERIKKLKEKVDRDDFKVQIIGTFKNGKSTFINSFLGEEVLPAYALPCTAVINEVKYGKSKKAVLHFKNPIPKTLPKELSKEALSHMKKYSMKNIPPMEIPYDKIEDYVVIPMGKDPKDMLLESPYEKVELYWPLDILKNGIEIIDSPGLNEHATRTKVTMDYISRADAVIFVLNATTLCSAEEMSFIENNLKKQGFDDMFFVVNRFDLIPDKEKSRIMNFAKKNLKEYTSFGEEGLFFVSARNGLDAKRERDREKLKQSAIPAFEKALAAYLTKNRGKIKMLSFAKEVNKILREEVLGKVIPRQREMLESTAEELKEKYSDIKPKLDSLQMKKNLLYERMMYSIEQKKAEIGVMASKNIGDIKKLIPIWVQDFTPSVNLGRIPGNAKAKMAVDEISAFISQKLEEKNTLWQEKELLPAMKDKAVEIFKPAEDELRLLMCELYSTEDALFGKAIDTGIGNYRFDYDYASVYGFGQEKINPAKGRAMKIAGETLVVMLSFSSPVALLGVITMMFVGSSKKGDSSALKKLKKSVVNEVSTNLENTAQQFVNAVTEGVSKSYMEMADKMIAPLNDEISEMQNQIEIAISDKESGESAVNTKKKTLDHVESLVKKLSEIIEVFVVEVIDR